MDGRMDGCMKAMNVCTMFNRKKSYEKISCTTLAQPMSRKTAPAAQGKTTRVSQLGLVRRVVPDNPRTRSAQGPTPCPAQGPAQGRTI